MLANSLSGTRYVYTRVYIICIYMSIYILYHGPGAVYQENVTSNIYVQPVDPVD